MNTPLNKRLNAIADYIEFHLGYNVRTTYKTKKMREQAAIYLFYVLAEEYTDAKDYDMAEIVHRQRSSVYLALKNHSDYAKDFYKFAYQNFNPFKAAFIGEGQPFSPTMDLIEATKEQIERDINDLIIKQVKNEKVFEVLNMVKNLDENQLDVILERLPPMIRMNESAN